MEDTASWINQQEVLHHFLLIIRSVRTSLQEVDVDHKRLIMCGDETGNTSRRLFSVTLKPRFHWPSGPVRSGLERSRWFRRAFPFKLEPSWSMKQATTTMEVIVVEFWFFVSTNHVMFFESRLHAAKTNTDAFFCCTDLPPITGFQQ